MAPHTIVTNAIHHIEIKNLDFYYGMTEVKQITQIEEVKEEIDEKKFILSLRYLKKKLPDEIIYEIYKFL